MYVCVCGGRGWILSGSLFHSSNHLTCSAFCRTPAHTHTHTHTRTHTHTQYIYIHTSTYIHTYIHTYARTRIQFPSQTATLIRTPISLIPISGGSRVTVAALMTCRPSWSSCKFLGNAESVNERLHAHFTCRLVRVLYVYLRVRVRVVLCQGCHM